MGSTSLLTRGSLAEVALPRVLRALALTRQHVVVELREPDGTIFGTLQIKAGQVLAAEQGGSHGREGFFALFERGAADFVVFRLPAASCYAEPIGSLAALLGEAQEREATEIDTAPPRLARGSNRFRTVPGGPRSRLLAVCSPKGGVGKTTVSLNLAVGLAERGLRTIVVDADPNGDLLSMLDARSRAGRGVYDLLDAPDGLEEALRSTRVANLRLLPATGAELPGRAAERGDAAEPWARLLARVGGLADVVLVDCPAGMLHTTQDVLRGVTHVLGVFQSEMVASRSFAMFLRGLSMVPSARRPELAGVVVNMFAGRSSASLEAFERLCAEGERHQLFETTIPRSEAFTAASLVGLPLRLAGDGGPSAVAWLFDALAAEVCSRVGLARIEPGVPAVAPFLM